MKKFVAPLYIALAIGLAGCSGVTADTGASPATATASAKASVKLDNFVGKNLKESTETLKAKGVEVEYTAEDASKSILAPSNWTITKQEPAAGGTASKVKFTAKKPDTDQVKAGDQAYADKVYASWLEARGAKTSADVLVQSPGDPQGYLVSAESPTTGTVVFTAQLAKGDVTKDELKKSAMAVLQLVGMQHTDLDRVEIVTADSLVRGVANRMDSPLLNQSK